MRLFIPVHPSDKFSYNSEAKEFVTEVSNLDGSFMSRIYDDACDEGFLLESIRTGKKVLFYLTNVHRHPTEWNEITHWEFQSQSGQYKAIIFND